MIVVGIDPGLSGAIARLKSEPGLCEIQAIDDMPVLSLPRAGKSKREIDAHALAILLGGHGIPGHAYVERVGPVPSLASRKPGANKPGGGQGVASAFAFGEGCGVIRGILASLGIPYTYVASQRWKKALGVPAAKDGARARASQLMPSGSEYWRRVKDDGRAEAALIALWGIRSFERIAAS